ncbi:MAG: hypothetical protein ACOZBL_02880 [Patescibacteria group bacterium]
MSAVSGVQEVATRPEAFTKIIIPQKAHKENVAPRKRFINEDLIMFLFLHLNYLTRNVPVVVGYVHVLQ